MNIFVIDPNDRISMVSSEAEAAQQPGMERFQSARQFSELAQAWSGSHLVRIWNQLPGVQPVKKFMDRNTAVTRIWNAIHTLEAARSVAPNKATNRSFGKNQIQTAHKNTKTAHIIGLLEQPSGSSLQALMQATGWQAHSVRGFLSRHLRKKLGLRVKSFRRNGERIYSIRR
jgi:Protein of unknown function (DUF3489)